MLQSHSVIGRRAPYELAHAEAEAAAADGDLPEPRTRAVQCPGAAADAAADEEAEEVADTSRITAAEAHNSNSRHEALQPEKARRPRSILRSPPKYSLFEQHYNSSDKCTEPPGTRRKVGLGFLWARC